MCENELPISFEKQLETTGYPKGLEELSKQRLRHEEIRAYSPNGLDSWPTWRR